MSHAQLETYGVQAANIELSNEEVYSYMRRLDISAEPRATAEQLINFITGGQVMTAVEGKRISQPVYRALSEGAKAGILSDDEQVVNPDTGFPNTVYRLLKVARSAKPERETWKGKALRLESEMKDLRERCDFLVDQNDRLREKLALALEKAGVPVAEVA